MKILMPIENERVASLLANAFEGYLPTETSRKGLTGVSAYYQFGARTIMIDWSPARDTVKVLSTDPYDVARASKLVCHDNYKTGVWLLVERYSEYEGFIEGFEKALGITVEADAEALDKELQEGGVL